MDDADKIETLRQAQHTLKMARQQAAVLDHKIDVLRRIADSLIVDIETSSVKVDETLYGEPPGHKIEGH